MRRSRSPPDVVNVKRLVVRLQLRNRVCVPTESRLCIPSFLINARLSLIERLDRNPLHDRGASRRFACQARLPRCRRAHTPIKEGRTDTHMDVSASFPLDFPPPNHDQTASRRARRTHISGRFIQGRLASARWVLPEQVSVGLFNQTNDSLRSSSSS